MKYEEMLTYWDKPTDGLTETQKARIEIIKENFKELDMSRWDRQGIYNAVALVYDIHTLFDDFIYPETCALCDDDGLMPNKGLSYDRLMISATMEANNIIKGLQTRSMISIPYTTPLNAYLSQDEKNYIRCV